MDDGKHILHKEILEEIAQQVHQQDVQKVKVEEKEMEVHPPLPFNLAKLQAHMNTKYGFTLAKTDQTVSYTHLIDIPDLTPDLLAEYSIVLQYMYNYFKYYDVPVEIKQKNIIKNIAPNMFDQDLIDIFRFEIKKTLKTQNSYSNLYLFDKIIEDNMNEIY